MDGFIFWRFAHPIIASASSQNDFLNTITVGLLDVLAIALLLLALVTYFFYSRTRRQSTQGWGSVPGRAQRNVSTFASIMLAVPVVWLLVVWVGTSAGQSSSVAGQPTTTSTAKPPNMTPSPRSNPTVTLASELVNPKSLTVGTVPNNEPLEFLDPTTQRLTGFDIELISDIAQKKSLKVNFIQEANFTSLFNDLNAKKFDVVISAISMSDKLQTQYKFVPYLHASESLLVKPGNPKQIHGLSDLCGLSVGVQADSTEFSDLQKTSDTCQTNGNVAINIMPGATETNVIQSLLNGTVDATYQDTSFSDYYKGKHPGKFDSAIMVPAPEEGIVIRNDDTAILKAVMDAFSQLQKDKTYSNLITKWSLTTKAIAEIDRRSWSIA